MKNYIIVLLCVCLSNRAICQSSINQFAGEWNGYLTQAMISYPAKMIIEATGDSTCEITIKLTDNSRIVFLYNGILRQRVIDSTYTLQMIAIEMKLTFTNKISGNKCKFKGGLICKTSDMTRTLSGQAKRNVGCAQPDYFFDFSKNLSDDEITGRLRETRRKDSLEALRRDATTIEYVNCDRTYVASKDSLFYSEFSCDQLNFFIVNGSQKAASINFAFPVDFFKTVDDRSNSIVSLLKNEKNIFDARLLGTWHSADYKFIYQIQANNNTVNNAFLFNAYVYGDHKREYMHVLPGTPLVATDIDSVYYLENESGKEKKWTPSVYKLINDSTIMLNPVSVRYRMKGTAFFSKYDYRNYFRKNQSNSDFVFHPIVLFRFTEDYISDLDKFVAEKKRAIIALADNLQNGRSVSRFTTLLNELKQFVSLQKEILGFDKFWNPVFPDSQARQKNLYRNSSGISFY